MLYRDISVESGGLGALQSPIGQKCIPFRQIYLPTQFFSKIAVAYYSYTTAHSGKRSVLLADKYAAPTFKALLSSYIRRDCVSTMRGHTCVMRYIMPIRGKKSVFFLPRY